MHTDRRFFADKKVAIANALHYHNLEYIYELELGGRIKRPDFKVVDDDAGEEWYLERCGMMEDPKYR